jgi:hypothetical protein
VPAETDLIRKIDFFEPLDQKIINKIAQMCIVREYSAGDCIVKQGESGLGLFFITRGRVKVEVDRNGSKAVVAQLQSEDFLGELSIIDNKPRSADVICLEDTSCLLLTRDSFSKLMNKYPEIAVQMAKALAGRIRATNDMMIQPSTVSAQSTTTAVPVNPVPQPAAVPVTPLPSKSGGNGTGTEASVKTKVKDFLVDTFSSLYTMKALTRFSAALVGCPVSVRPDVPDGEAAQATIGEVKLVLVPAGDDQTLTIEAYDEGSFSATVLQPREAGPAITRFDGHIRRHDAMRLLISSEGFARIEPHCGPGPADSSEV